MNVHLPQLRDAFPRFDFEVPAVVTGAWGFGDTSWRNDACPSFDCDVFVLWIDYSDPLLRELPGGPQFVMHDEGVTVLQTDSWDDVRAFVEDGKRHFPEWSPRPAIIYLTDAFKRFVEREGLPAEGDSEDLLISATLTPGQAEWLREFSAVWGDAEAEDPDFYAKQPVVEA